MIGLEEILRLKVRLLTEGARLPEDEWTGRRGGAGPVGGRYFLLPNGRPCSVPIRQGQMADRFHSATIHPTDDPEIWLYDGSVQLRMVPRPDYLDMTTEDGTAYSKLALLHGSECLATTVYQDCRYWKDGTQCAFCTIPLSGKAGDTIPEKSPEQVAEVVLAAEREGIAKHLLLTTGTPDTNDVGIDRLIRIIRGVRSVSEIPIGVQFEPPLDLELIDMIADAGANAVGVHIESADEAIREKMCPGKHEYGDTDLYMRVWQHAVKRFGRGNVSTFLLHGLSENLDVTLDFIRKIAELGVMPVVAPVRPAPGSQIANTEPSYLRSLDSAVEFYKILGTILYRWDFKPSTTAAGCHRCGGCTPIQEAYDWAASQPT